ncbi:MAG: hypothetical protein EOP48_14765 [Sphingobacteriales bacterium]|nr:MAG: hypothetical protein EOP48_14765 [Sphingobacteriales bacterium]
MGRNPTGATTVYRCKTLSISNFADHLRKDSGNATAQVRWNDNNDIRVNIRRTASGYELQIEYSVTDGEGKHPISYIVPIVSTASNLGKGMVHYFLCPFSGQRCRSLYLAYGSHYFKSRKAYRHRIYYPSQLSSRLDKFNDTYWRLESRIERLQKAHRKEHYRGKATRVQERIERLQEQKQYCDIMRWKILPKALLKSMAQYGISDPKQFF